MLLGIYTPTLFLDGDTIYNIVDHTERWCSKNLGRRKRLTIHITKQSIWKSPCYGCYDSDNRTMYIYKNRCLNVEEIIKVILHEYTHHLQDLSQYEYLLEKYGYENHPLEIEAKSVADKYYRTIWKLIKNKI